MEESKRQLKFSKLIREDLSQIFQRRFQGDFQGSLVTIVGVEMSPDLGLAKVHISVFPINKSEETLTKINDSKSLIRKDLGLRIGKQVRIVPEIAFFVDETAEEASRIDKIIDDLTIPPNEEAQE